MRARLIAGVLSLLVAADAAAQDVCAQFSWTVGRKIDLFADYMPTLESAQSLPKEGVFALILRPIDEVIYLVAPERGRDGGYGGIVTIEHLPAGRYKIALSQDAWLDVVQGNARLPLKVTSGPGEQCGDVRRSVQVEANDLPLTLQLGGATASRINIAVVRIWPPEWRW